jgi:hypothetical protein
MQPPLTETEQSEKTRGELSFNSWLQKSSTSCEEGDTEAIASPLRDSRGQKDLRSSLQLVP